MAPHSPLLLFGAVATCAAVAISGLKVRGSSGCSPMSTEGGGLRVTGSGLRASGDPFEGGGSSRPR